MACTVPPGCTHAQCRMETILTSLPAYVAQFIQNIRGNDNSNCACLMHDTYAGSFVCGSVRITLYTATYVLQLNIEHYRKPFFFWSNFF